MESPSESRVTRVAFRAAGSLRSQGAPQDALAKTVGRWGDNRGEFADYPLREPAGIGCVPSEPERVCGDDCLKTLPVSSPEPAPGSRS